MSIGSGAVAVVLSEDCAETASVAVVTVPDCAAVVLGDVDVVFFVDEEALDCETAVVVVVVVDLEDAVVFFVDDEALDCETAVVVVVVVDLEDAVVFFVDEEALDCETVVVVVCSGNRADISVVSGSVSAVVTVVSVVTDTAAVTVSGGAVSSASGAISSGCAGCVSAAYTVRATGISGSVPNTAQPMQSASIALTKRLHLMLINFLS